MGNFSLLGLRLAAYMLASLFVGLTVREYARAWTAAKLGDPTPRLWGRITLRPKPWFDPFGSGFLPILEALVWSVRAFIMPAAYAKPAPVDPNYLRRGPRDVVIVSIAGPAASLVLTIVAGLALRVGVSGEGALLLTTFAFTNASLMVFHLLPIPGLDGGRLLTLVLPPQAREVFRNADRYLPLIVLVVVFVFTFVLQLASLLTGAVCEAASGVDCLRLLQLA
jgi:Zn-dependent protease